MSLAGRVGSSALNWLVGNVGYFDPFPLSAPPNEQSQTSLSELALLIYQLGRRLGFKHDVRVVRCLDLIEQVYRDPLLHEFPFRYEPRAFIGHLIIWCVLQSRNSEAIVPRWRLQKLLDTEKVLADTQEPYRILELKYFVKASELRCNFPSENEIFSHTLLGKHPHVIPTDESAIYAITHTLFYATDFGLAQPDYLFGSRHASILELVQILLRVVLDAKHWDLVGELIICHRCLDQTEVPLLTEAWDALSRIQNKDGMLSSTSEYVGYSLSSDLQKQSAFRRFYHRTLVAVMAGFLGIETT